MAYEDRRQAEVGSRGNLVGCAMWEHHAGVCYSLEHAHRLQCERVASRHSLKDKTRLLYEDPEVSTDQNLPRD